VRARRYWIPGVCVVSLVAPSTTGLVARDEKFHGVARRGAGDDRAGDHRRRPPDLRPH
jgi:hypothetical protein